MIREVGGWEEDDDLWYDEDEEPFCYTCQSTGRIPARDYEAITGCEGWACPDCDRGQDTDLPYRPIPKQSIA